jgi:sortase A
MVTSAVRRRGRNTRRWVGLALVLTGLSALSWAGWQFYGTNVIAHGKHEQAVSDVRERWRAGAALSERSEGDVRAVLHIPRFGEDWEVPIIDSVSDDALAAGVGRFVDNASVGAVGNYALAAHRVTQGEPFKKLTELVAGDEVVVETQKYLYTYVLDTNGTEHRVSFTDTWVLDDRPVELPSRRVITLTTCAELFHTDDRLAVFGHLVSKDANPTY